jgi:Holliday junction resolvasome RuvABC endonuclease subunit
MILALDLGTKTGWAIGRKETSLHIHGSHDLFYYRSGVIDFTPKRMQSHGQRYIEFKRFLSELYIKYKFTWCCYEEVRKHVGVDAAHMYGGFKAHLDAWCIENDIENQGIPVGTIKKHITGHGRADKDQMIEAVKTKLKIFPKDHNEADAIALCDYILTNKTIVK